MFNKIKKSYFIFLVVSLVLTDIILLFGSACTDNARSNTNQNGGNTEQNASNGNRNSDNQTAPNAATDGQIPAKVYKVLDYVRQNKAPMPNYVGSRIFGNRERRLPAKDANGRKMKYQEWDVNPKKNGKNRGAERLITAENGQAWYTDDHYDTFTEIRK